MFNASKLIFANCQKVFTRIFWILLYIASIYGLFYYISGCYTKWLRSPDIITKVTQRNNTEFPIPAVTICPGITGRSDMINLKDLKRQAESFSDEEAKVYHRMRDQETSDILNVTIEGLNEDACAILYLSRAFCTYKGKQNILFNTASCNDFLFANLSVRENSSFFRLLDKRSLNLEEITQSKDEVRGRKVLVSPYGVCYSINLYSKEIFEAEMFKDLNDFYDENDQDIEWSNDRGYINKSSENPFRYDDNDEEYSVATLNFFFNQSDIENVCDEKKMKVIFHPVNEIPTRFHDAVDVEFENNGVFEIELKSFRMSDDLRRIDASYRKCYFEDERKLKYFKKYSEVHCKLECLKEFMCNVSGTHCELFEFPLTKNAGNSTCRSWQLLGETRTPEYKKHMLKCDCLPNCNYLKYLSKFIPNEYEDSASRIVLWSTSPFVEETEQFSTYILANLISDIGGYLGLFLGCSLLSIVKVAGKFLIGLLRMERCCNKSEAKTTKEIKELRTQIKELKNLIKDSEHRTNERIDALVNDKSDANSLKSSYECS